MKMYDNLSVSQMKKGYIVTKEIKLGGREAFQVESVTEKYVSLLSKNTLTVTQVSTNSRVKYIYLKTAEE